MEVGRIIKSIRKEKGLTQAELGAKLGVSASMIGQYENGFRRPSKKNLLKILNALEFEFSSFLLRAVSVEQISAELDMPEETVIRALNDDNNIEPAAKAKILHVAFMLALELSYSSETPLLDFEGHTIYRGTSDNLPKAHNFYEQVKAFLTPLNKDELLEVIAFATEMLREK